MAGLNLNDRQKQIVTYVKKTGKITNSEYQRLMSVAKRTAHRDLSDLVEKGLFIKIGTRGKGTFYKLQRKGP
jgi:ATP-dependent DNA helicase RecG